MPYLSEARHHASYKRLMNHPPGPPDNWDERLEDEPSGATDNERRGVRERQLTARLRGLGYQVTGNSVMSMGGVPVYTYALIQIPGRVGPCISFYITTDNLICSYLHAQGTQVVYNHNIAHFIPNNDDFIIYVQTTLGPQTQAAPQTQALSELMDCLKSVHTRVCRLERICCSTHAAVD